jgi:hypothetical protein
LLPEAAVEVETMVAVEAVGMFTLDQDYLFRQVPHIQSQLVEVDQWVMTPMVDKDLILYLHH